MTETEKTYSQKEENLNIYTHGFGLVMSVIACVFLILKAITMGGVLNILSFGCYGLSLIILYTASTFYHASTEPKIRKRLNIFDHAAIYVLIAGTYTPFALIVLKGWIGWTIFGLSWGLALVGIILKLFYTGKYDKISTAAYVLMGWIIIIAIKPLITNFSFDGLMWLFGGGVAYTIGAVLYNFKRLKYNHAVFHVFVLIGSFCHFVAAYFYILPTKI